MKKISSYCLSLVAAILCMALGACSDFEPTGYTEVPGLAKAYDLKAAIDGHKVNLSWSVPNAEGVTGVLLIHNGDFNNAVRLAPTENTYQVIGMPMGQENIYTVKVTYEGNYISEGVSVPVLLPQEDFANVSNLKAAVTGRSVALTWTLPQGGDITGVRVITNGNTDAAIELPADATSYTMRGQAMDEDLTYTVQLMYDTYYPSTGVSVDVKIPYIEPKAAYLLLAATPDALPDDDERAAAAWFAQQPDAVFVHVNELATLDADVYSVLWIEIDRVGLPLGWENLPSEITSIEAIEALKDYSARGGSLYLANMATQLTVPLGFVPDNMAPTVYGNGDGGTGDDVWVINPYLGWQFQDGGDQGFYDRTMHAIYAGLTLEDPNGYGYLTLPLIGPGQREDHNCLWDCNIYGRGTYPDVIKNFEVNTNSLVLATWGHVRDHCVAGLVEFNANAEHGRCIANGLAAYEWNQNSGPNPYQKNIEGLTNNILNYLK